MGNRYKTSKNTKQDNVNYAKRWSWQWLSECHIWNFKNKSTCWPNIVRSFKHFAFVLVLYNFFLKIVFFFLPLSSPFLFYAQKVFHQRSILSTQERDIDRQQQGEYRAICPWKMERQSFAKPQEIQIGNKQKYKYRHAQWKWIKIQIQKHLKNWECCPCHSLFKGTK